MFLHLTSRAENRVFCVFHWEIQSAFDSFFNRPLQLDLHSACSSACFLSFSLSLFSASLYWRFFLPKINTFSVPFLLDLNAWHIHFKPGPPKSFWSPELVKDAPCEGAEDAESLAGAGGLGGMMTSLAGETKASGLTHTLPSLLGLKDWVGGGGKEPAHPTRPTSLFNTPPPFFFHPTVWCRHWIPEHRLHAVSACMFHFHELTMKLFIWTNRKPVYGQIKIKMNFKKTPLHPALTLILTILM